MSSEQRGFVFAVTFIVIFSVLLATIPTDFQGQEETPEMLIPLDPSMITGFSDFEDYQKNDFEVIATILVYDYLDLAGRDWRCAFVTNEFYLGAKILYGGFLWLGTMDTCKFISPEAIDREDSLSFAEIEADAEDGVISYNLQYYANGASAGKFIVYWNTTTYGNDSEDAWGNNELFLIHGVGISATATGDIGSLLISLLLLQLPDVPLLVNILLVTPIWACIIFVLWFIIKEMIPFV